MEANCAHLFWYDIDEKRARKVEFGSCPMCFSWPILVPSVRFTWPFVMEALLFSTMIAVYNLN